VEDRIAKLKYKVDIKKKRTCCQLKSYERNMQELINSIKRINLRIMSIEEEPKGKRICNIFNKIIT
jgi:hypothetical protein